MFVAARLGMKRSPGVLRTDEGVLMHLLEGVANLESFRPLLGVERQGRVGVVHAEGHLGFGVFSDIFSVQFCSKVNNVKRLQSR